ncbi:lipoate--protein ligase family protein [Bifidobacterium sp. ESL0790]|uniref:lipoate--protein ligase family protein n=1 Tax=Bifidobacterium sp. ESL0790 TaxID=2983233 RepID=UPI0023F91C05|nr:lipoate--protein ligase family protein [Bifidobacterium sp. ESL0790]WEV72193.1 lipoate--protein ligase family protein [Bifidobacterium sp. ESL0790]
MRGEYKTPGGKLVAVNIEVDGSGLPVSCVIDGDFFIDTDDDDDDAQALLAQLGKALVGGSSLEDVFAAHPSTTLVGAGAHALREAYRRAFAKTNVDLDGSNGEVAVGPSYDTSISALDNIPGKTSGKAPDKTVKNVAHAPLDANLDSFSANFQTVKPAGVEFLTGAGDADIEKHKILRQWHLRWNSLRPKVVVDSPRSPAEQMEVDARWAREVAEGERPATLRFWNWSGPAVVVGRFQSIDDEVDLETARREGFEVVRRPTGGGAMFVEPAGVITFSLYVPSAFVEGMSVPQSYEFLDLWLVEALRELGLDVGFSGMNDIASSRGKIGGTAQRRYPSRDGSGGSILHHVTLDYSIDAGKMSRLLKTSPEKRRDKAVKSAVKSVDPLKRQTGMTRGQLVAHLVSRASRRYNIN